MLKGITKGGIVVFPSHNLDPERLIRVSELIGTLTICLPWCMEIPRSTRETDGEACFHVLRPPENLKPPETFLKLLKDYLRWMENNPGRIDSAWVTASANAYLEEDARWEIQGLIRQDRTGNGQEKKEDRALRWHLITHLAGKMETDRRQAEDALRLLQGHSSPLEGALGEDFEGTGLLDDISESFVSPIIEDRLIADICESWLGLFGTRIERQAILLTFDERIGNYLKGIFEESLSVIDGLQCVPGVTFTIGATSSSPPAEQEISLMNKTAEKVLMSFAEIGQSLQKEGAINPGELEKTVSKMQINFPLKSTSKNWQIDVLAFPVVEGGKRSQAQSILSELSGKTLVLLKEGS